MSSSSSPPTDVLDSSGGASGGASGVAPPSAGIQGAGGSVFAHIPRSANVGSGSVPEGIESENPMIPADKPFFNVCIGKTETAPTYYMALAMLPRCSVQARVKVLGDRLHIMQWFGTHKLLRFEKDGWHAFVLENEIKMGDFIVFEVHKSTSKELEMRAHVLHPSIPPELQRHLEGRSADNAITFD